MNTVLNLTPNRRLGRFLHQQDGGHYNAWNDWFLETWQRDYEKIVGDKPLQCLSDWQSALLWQEVIRALQSDPLLNLSQAAQHARQAWSLAIQWRCDPQLWKGEKLETDSFLNWLHAYQARCAASQWIDRALLPERLFHYWQEHPESAPQQVNFYGFDEFTPLQLAIIEAWKAGGSSIYIEPAPSEVQPYRFLSFPDRATQLTEAALYAKSVLEAEPQFPIGIIIPAIQDHWAEINDTFTEILGPEQPFNISAGQPLGQCPIIYAALQCLQADSVSYLLRTPYISGGLTEASARALCDRKLSDLEKDPLPLEFVRQHLSLPEEFKTVFNAAMDTLEAYHQIRLLPSEWIEKIFHLLTVWGWPGERRLNSEAYQAVSHFYALITELSSLDQVLGLSSFSSLLSLFTQRLHQTMFQAESQDKPVQVLGFLEAAGLRFSHLWVMDMGSDTWPAKPQPNPFIPMSEQIRLGIPHASFARELRFAQTMTKRMLTSSEDIIMSYAMHGEEGEATVLPTPLLSEPVIPGTHSNSTPGLFAQSEGAITDPLPEPIGLPLQDFHLKGGAGLFKDQADCPFRAYAKHRLAADRPEPPTLGLSHRKKGSLVHDILERIWSGLKSQEALMLMGQEALKKTLQDTIDQVLKESVPPLSPIECSLEAQRLFPLLMDWFDQELARKPFKIASLEKEQHVTLEGLSLKLRADRLDRVDGKICIIDYKTGAVDPKAWLDERMDEPQLPLYACVNDERPEAIAFAQIRKDEMGWKGLGTLEFPEQPPINDQTWQEQLTQWKASFAQLAKEYKEGYAAVLPKHGSQTCQYCEVKSFCRINDAQ